MVAAGSSVCKTMLLSPVQAGGRAARAAPSPERHDLRCPFCASTLHGSTSRFDTVLASSPDARLLPALGMLVPGYLLITSREHLLSMAVLGADRLGEVLAWTTALTSALAPTFGDYLIFEHGSCAAGSGGACVDHAHMHLVPLAQELAPHLIASVRWQELTEYKDLSELRDGAYAYLGFGGRHMVLPEPRLGSQWIRRQIGELIHTDTWDWAVEPGWRQLQQTFTCLPDLRALSASASVRD
jgi:diadenosine tetraphosphate (Ap4A) HIT family hydrolase